LLKRRQFGRLLRLRAECDANGHSHYNEYLPHGILFSLFRVKPPDFLIAVRPFPGFRPPWCL
jgi:hypothetical protein